MDPSRSAGYHTVNSNRDTTDRIDLDFAKQDGLITAVVQDANSRRVLMVGCMNADAWRLTRETGFVHYYSRTRERLWKKGETSGHVQRVLEIRVDCDQDAILILVDQEGGICCHTGRPSCFFRRVDGDRLEPVQI